ncbi:cytochrome P450 [Phlebopus sp. FC_14]|nr:cytochrome P450 [Phlebopus sp. FC_14]
MSLLQFASAAVLLVALYSEATSYLRRQRMPPGPPGIPILGNAMQLPTTMAWFRLTEWKEKYGPIYSLNLAGQPVVVLNTHKTAADLLDRRSHIYSDRPRLIMAGEILTGGIYMVFVRYGALWRRMRRASHDSFNLRSVEKYQPALFTESALNILDITDDPNSWEDCLVNTAASNILAAVYGRTRITRTDKSLLTRIHGHTARLASATAPGAFLVELFPFMLHFPRWLAKWKRDGIAWHEEETRFLERLSQEAMETDVGHMMRQLAESEQRHGLSEKEMAWLAGIMLGAGSETTSGSLLSFVLAMVLHPEVVRKAQAEIDAVVGRDRLPSYEDKEKLPYVRAILKETLRWRPVGPLAVPRRVTEDDWYEGYFIPKGTMVLPNVWAMNRLDRIHCSSVSRLAHGFNLTRDPEVFPDFDEFRPERFLDETGKVDHTPPDTHSMGHVTFGFGRRICAGYNFANHVLFIQMAMLLWAFHFDKALQADGQPVIPSKDDFIDAGVVVFPAPFKCKITPRFEGLRSVIQREIENLGIEM